MNTIFLSYSHADAPFVHRLHGDLIKRGLTVWIDETSIPPGAGSKRAKTYEIRIDGPDGQDHRSWSLLFAQMLSFC